MYRITANSWVDRDVNYNALAAHITEHIYKSITLEETAVFHCFFSNPFLVTFSHHYDYPFLLAELQKLADDFAFYCKETYGLTLTGSFRLDIDPPTPLEQMDITIKLLEDS